MVYTIGETVYDIIFKNNKPVDAKCGGAMLNTAVSLGRLNVPVSFISEYATDTIGKITDDFLQTNHVDTAHICRFAGTSPVALAFLDNENNASYDFHRHYPADRLNAPLPEPGANDFVLFGSSYAFNHEIRKQLLTFIKKARQNGAFILYDPNFRQAHAHELNRIRPLIEENIQLSNMVRASDEDMLGLFSTNTPETAYAKIKSLGCHYFAYTASSAFSAIYTPAKTIRIAANNIKTVSTIGAGDTFNAGILYSLVSLQKEKVLIHQMTNTQLNSLLANAIIFAEAVCQSYENYLPLELAQKHKLE